MLRLMRMFRLLLLLRLLKIKQYMPATLEPLHGARPCVSSYLAWCGGRYRYMIALEEQYSINLQYLRILQSLMSLIYLAHFLGVNIRSKLTIYCLNHPCDYTLALWQAASSWLSSCA